MSRRSQLNQVNVQQEYGMFKLNIRQPNQQQAYKQEQPLPYGIQVKQQNENNQDHYQQFQPQPLSQYNQQKSPMLSLQQRESKTPNMRAANSSEITRNKSSNIRIIATYQNTNQPTKPVQQQFQEYTPSSLPQQHLPQFGFSQAPPKPTIEPPKPTIAPSMNMVQTSVRKNDLLSQNDNQSSIVQPIKNGCYKCTEQGTEYTLVSSYCGGCHKNIHISCIIQCLMSQAQKEYQLRSPCCNRVFKLSRLKNVIDPLYLNDKQVKELRSIEEKLAINQLKQLATTNKKLIQCINQHCNKERSYLLYDQKQSSIHCCPQCLYYQCLKCKKLLKDKFCDSCQPVVDNKYQKNQTRQR